MVRGNRGRGEEKQAANGRQRCVSGVSCCAWSWRGAGRQAGRRLQLWEAETRRGRRPPRLTPDVLLLWHHLHGQRRLGDSHIQVLGKCSTHPAPSASPIMSAAPVPGAGAEAQEQGATWVVCSLRCPAAAKTAASDHHAEAQGAAGGAARTTNVPTMQRKLQPTAAFAKGSTRGGGPVLCCALGAVFWRPCSASARQNLASRVLCDTTERLWGRQGAARHPDASHTPTPHLGLFGLHCSQS